MKLYLKLVAKLGTCKSSICTLATWRLTGVNRSWRATEAWHYGNPEDAIGEDTVSVAVKTQHIRCQDCGKIKDSSRCGLELGQGDEAHVLWMAEPEKQNCPSFKIMSESQIPYTDLHCWFQFCFVPGSSLLK